MTTISLQTIHDETLWVAKMQGYREVGTYAEIGYLAHDFDCRDFDTVCADGQPESVRPFWEAYEAYGVANGWMTTDDFYRNVYAVEALKADPSLGEYVKHESERSRKLREIAEAEAKVKAELYRRCNEAERDLCEALNTNSYMLSVFDNFVYFADATVCTMLDDLDEELVCNVMREHGFYFLRAEGDELHFVTVA